MATNNSDLERSLGAWEVRPEWVVNLDLTGWTRDVSKIK